METLGWLLIVASERDAAEALARIHDVAYAPFATRRRGHVAALDPDADRWSFGGPEDVASGAAADEPDAYAEEDAAA